MTPREIQKMFESIPGLGKDRVCYWEFSDDSAPELPFGAWYITNSTEEVADGVVWCYQSSVTFELYSEVKDYDLERAVEAVFEKSGISWHKAEQMLTADNMHVAVYTMTLFITLD